MSPSTLEFIHTKGSCLGIVVLTFQNATTHSQPQILVRFNLSPLARGREPKKCAQRALGRNSTAICTLIGPPQRIS